MNAEAPQGQSILILKAKKSSLVGAEGFLKNREWKIRSHLGLKEALASVFKKVPDLAIICGDHPQKMVRMLPRILKEKMGVPVILYFENTPMNLSAVLEQMGCEYVLFQPVSGPAIERMILKMQKDAAQKAEGGGGSGEGGQAGGEGDEDGVNHIKGESDKENKRASGLADLQSLLRGDGGGDGATIARGGKPGAEKDDALMNDDDDDSSGGTGGGLMGKAPKAGAKPGAKKKKPGQAGDGDSDDDDSGSEGDLASMMAKLASGNFKPGDKVPTGAKTEGASGDEPATEEEFGGFAAADDKKPAAQASTEEEDDESSSTVARGPKRKKKTKKQTRPDGTVEEVDDGYEDDEGTPTTDGGTIIQKGAKGPKYFTKTGKADVDAEGSAVQEAPEDLTSAPSVQEQLTEQAEASAGESSEEPKDVARTARKKRDKNSTGYATFTQEEHAERPNISRNKTWISPESSLNENSVLIQGAQQAIDESAVNPEAEPAHEISVHTRVACIVLESERFQGYMIAAMAQDRQIDDDFMKAVRKRLVAFLRAHGEKNVNDSGLALTLNEVEFEDWAVEQADFLRKSVHDGEEIAMAFFPFAETSIEYKPSKREEFYSIGIADVHPDQLVDFDIFIYLPKNDRYILYTQKGHTFFGNQKERLVFKGIDRMHIKKDAVTSLKRYRAQSFLNDSIAGFRAAIAAKKKPA